MASRPVDLLALRFFKLQKTLPTLMREKLNLFLVWEWMLVSENSRVSDFSPLSFGVWRKFHSHQGTVKC
jgi:hypothetical protein